jgi:CubicO group peptidase (beta-lactamase class C family)
MKKNTFITLVSFLVFLSCSKDDNNIKVVLPTITTTPSTSITFSTAISGGNITNNGGADITARGVCWSTTQNPTIANSKTTDGSGTGVFSATISGLNEDTSYYVRAYATNSLGTAYGNQISFSTAIESLYFPPLTTDAWETKTIADLNWKQSAVQPLLDFLEAKNSKGFMILVNGRIVLENYFNGHSATTNWYWASAGKTLTATMTGIAQQEGLLNINNKVSDYIGSGWTSAPLAKENLITCKNLLNMTSGLDDSTDDVNPANLIYVADSGTRWAYHNVYVKLQDVIGQASGTTWNSYFNTKLRDQIAMNGLWLTSGNNIVYWSSTRSMARFGLLMYNKGKWENNQILNQNYFNEATNTSQNINLGYGYLWWLNGKTSYHLPQSQIQFPGTLIATAPNDMFMALGKNDQKIYVIPSKKMVVIRMGEVANPENPTFALSGFDEELWVKISALYQ